MFAFAAALPILFADTQTVRANVCPQPLETVITSPVEGSKTDNGTALMSGTTYAESTIKISTNGKQVVTVFSDESGDFSANVPLVAGRNDLNAHIIDICDRPTDAGVSITYTPKAPPPKPSKPATATPDSSGSITPSAPAPKNNGQPTRTTAPNTGTGTTTTEPTTEKEPEPENLRIELTHPKQNSRINQPSVMVIGSTNLASTITITVNDEIVTTYAVKSTDFKVLVPLNYGENRIAVQATSDKQTESANVTVERVNSDGSLYERQDSLKWYQTVQGIVAIGTAASILFITSYFVVRFH